MTTDSVKIPGISTSVRMLPQNTLIQVTSDQFGPGDRGWPEFHSGVTAALRTIYDTNSFDSSDISFNQANEFDAKYAGFLLGLGITRHIRSMALFQAFSFLDPKHELTSIGVLLGLSTAFMGTGDAKVTSVLSVHLSALHPPNSSTLQVSLLIQAAGLLGLGFLYFGTSRRTLAETMVRELTNTKVVGIEHPDGCREAYGLSAGFAFGLIMLGEGKKGGTDATFLRKFRALISGDGVRALPGSKDANLNSLDISVTSPAATVGIALMYLDSQRQDVVDLLEIPQSLDRLDYVRRDLILLRTTCRALIMRQTIGSSAAWVESQIPNFILKAVKAKDNTIQSWGDIEMAYWHIVAGAAFAMALRYAGTARAEAHATLLDFFQRLVKANSSKGEFIISVAGFIYDLS